MLDLNRGKEDQAMPEAAARHPDADYLEEAIELAGVDNIQQLARKAGVDPSGLHKRIANTLPDRLSQPTMEKIDAAKIYPARQVPDTTHAPVIFRRHLERWLQMLQRNAAPEPMETVPLPASRYPRVVIRVAKSVTNAAFDHPFSAILEIGNNDPLVDGLFYIITLNDDVPPPDSDYPGHSAFARQWSAERQVWYARERYDLPEIEPKDVQEVVGCITGYLVDAHDRLDTSDTG